MNKLYCFSVVINKSNKKEPSGLDSVKKIYYISSTDIKYI